MKRIKNMFTQHTETTFDLSSPLGIVPNYPFVEFMRLNQPFWEVKL